MIRKFEEYFTTLCNWFEKKETIDEEYDNYNEIIYAKYHITKNQRIKASLFICSILFIILIICDHYVHFKMENLLVSVCLIFFLYLYLKNYHKLRILEKEYEFGSFYQILFLELSILIKTIPIYEDRNSLIINLLAKDPNISPNIQEIYLKICQGSGLEKSLQEIIFYSPKFQEYFRKIIDYNYNTNSLQLYDDFLYYYQKEFESFIKSFESKLNFYFFVSIFFPIGFIYYTSLNTINIISVILILNIFFSFEHYFSHYFLDNKIPLLGIYNLRDPNEQILFASFFNLLTHLSYSLQIYSPDYAFLDALVKLSKKEALLFNINLQQFQSKFYAFDFFLIQFFNNIENSNIRIFQPFFEIIFKKTSDAIFFKDISNMMYQQNQLMEQHKMIIKSAQFRINIFKFLICVILGVLTPIIIQLKIITSFFNDDFFENDSNFDDFQFLKIYFFLICLIFVITGIKSLNSLYNNTNFKKIDLILIIIYIFCYFETNLLMFS